MLTSRYMRKGRESAGMGLLRAIAELLTNDFSQINSQTRIKSGFPVFDSFVREAQPNGWLCGSWFLWKCSGSTRIWLPRRHYQSRFKWFLTHENFQRSSLETHIHRSRNNLGTKRKELPIQNKERGCLEKLEWHGKCSIFDHPGPIWNIRKFWEQLFQWTRFLEFLNCRTFVQIEQW